MNDKDHDKDDDGEFQTVSRTADNKKKKKRRLFIGNLPLSTTKKDLVEFLRDKMMQDDVMPNGNTSSNDHSYTRTVSSSLLSSIQEHHVEFGQSTTTNKIPGKQGSKHAFLSELEQNVGKQMISKLHNNAEIEPGHRITVQWEHNPPVLKNRSNSNTNFGRKGNNRNNNNKLTKTWSKPTPTPSASSSSSSSSVHSNNETDKKHKHPPSGHHPAQKEDPQATVTVSPQSLQEAAERVESIVREEQKQWTEEGDSAMLQSSIIAATAAVSLVASTGFNIQPEETVNGGMKSLDFSSTVGSAGIDKSKDSTPNFSFTNLNSPSFPNQGPQSLASLLEEYGEYDPDWNKQHYPIIDSKSEAKQEEEKMNTGKTKSMDSGGSTLMVPTDGNQQQHQRRGESRLGQHGKAPLHVDFVSFGYRYGAPSHFRQHGCANPHAQPLPLFDTRGFPSVPSHLFGPQDGLSGLVRRILLDFKTSVPMANITGKENDNDSSGDESDGEAATKDDGTNKTVTSLVALAKYMADQASLALQDAMIQGEYGYAQPLRMTIYVGSDFGKHRSVVAVEAAATALRKRLRSNLNGCFSQPVSVGTQHRDIAKQQQQQQQTRKPQAGGTARIKNIGFHNHDDDW